MMVSVDQLFNRIFVYFELFNYFIPSSLILNFFQYTINPIQRYSRQYHLLSSAINTLLLYVSFKSTFVDFAFVFNMLALSAVFILSSLCACVLFSLSATKLSFDLLYQVLVPGSVLLSQKTRHKAQLTFYLS